MSPKASADMLIARRFPRVSGDEPNLCGAEHLFIGFSPRERG